MGNKSFPLQKHKPNQQKFAQITIEAELISFRNYKRQTNQIDKTNQIMVVIREELAFIM